MNNKTRNLVLAGCIAALVTVGTMLIQIPTGIGGYIHMGDSMVYLAGCLLGPVIGGMAAGIGSLMADIMSGYAIYAIPTFLIKFLDAFLIGTIYYKFNKKDSALTQKMLVYLFGITLGTAVMASGYFLYEAVLYGVEAALPMVAANLFQGVVGGAIGFPLLVAIEKTNAVKTYKLDK